MSGHFLKAFGVASLASLALCGAAQAKVPDISGAYDLKAADVDKVNAKAGCIEHWHLRGDGSLLVESDQEQVHGQWRVTSRDKTVLQLTWSHQTTNGLPDCWGHISATPVQDVEILFYLNSLDGLVLVKPAATDPKMGVIYQLAAVAKKVSNDK